MKQALQDLINLLADGVNDSIQAAQPGANLLGKILGYENLVADVLKLAPELGEIPADVTGLNAADVEQLVAGLVAKFAITNEKALARINAILALANSIVTNDVPLVHNVIASFQA